MASAATARALVPSSEAWQWPRKFRPKESFRARRKLPNECDFDYEVRRLNLIGASLARLLESKPLRYWAILHAKTRYIPTDLLDAWGIVVNFETELF